MSSRSRRLSNWGGMTKQEAQIVTPGYSKDISLFWFLLNEYGTFEFVIDLADSVIDLGRRFFKDKKRYQQALTIMKYGVPAAVFTFQLASKMHQYRKIKSGNNNIYNEREDKVKQVLDIAKKKDICIGQDELLLGKDVFYWLFKMPKTEGFKIIGYFNYENLQPVADVWKIEQGTMLIVLEYDGARFAWITNMVATVLDDMLVRESFIYYQSMDFEKKLRLKAAIYKEFLNHFDIKNNIICLHPSGLHAFPRQDAQEQIRQFDIKKFAAEIKKVLGRKKKRGFAFVGIPGTGKSTIIKKLENEITDYPIVYTTAANYSSQFEIQETFTTIMFIQPCIVIMEDLDSYDLRDKKSNLGVFLDLIDDVNQRLNAVFIATINDTSLVHYTLINRPGRLDQVIMIKPPQDIEEVFSVMRMRFMKNKKNDENIRGDFLPLGEIDRKILDEIVKAQYTQADICEVIEKALLLEDAITNDTLRESLKKLKDSKEAIKACNFKGEDPRGDLDNRPTEDRAVGRSVNPTEVLRYANRT